MHDERYLSGEALLLFLLMVLGWATMVGMLIEHDRDTDRRIQGIEERLCRLGVRGGPPGPACPETK
jgi:hypothetical protein